MADASGFITLLDGREATAADLAPLAFAGFAHFTAMQVRDGRVRGLDLHLARLRLASLDFFGRALPDDEVRAHLARAVENGPPRLSLTATMFSRAGEFTAAGAPDDPAILVRTGPASDGPVGPLRLAVAPHERPLAAIKHVGEATKTHFLRESVRQGFDDAAFVDSLGRLSEATIWNFAFWDGEAVVWPEAAKLPGVTMGVVRRRLALLGVPQRDQAVTPDGARRLLGAAVMNSWTPAVAVSRIGTVDLPEASGFVKLLHEAYSREPAAGLAKADI